jgi:hypothetical protein
VSRNIILVNEAEGLTPGIQSEFFPEWNMIRSDSKSLLVGVRDKYMTKPEGPTSTLRILYDHSSEVYERHREFRDDPTVNSFEEYLWHMVVQVRFGKVLLPDEDGKERRVLMKQTLSSWESQLPAELFSKVSRSLLVNTKAISKLVKRDPTTWELHFQGIKTPIILSNLESRRLREVMVNTS